MPAASVIVARGKSITKGHDLPAKYMIHTVGPIWHGGSHGEDQYLFSCYKNSLLPATWVQIQKIAFPNISTGIYGYPKEKVAREALAVVKPYQKLDQRLKKIIFCCFNQENYKLMVSAFGETETDNKL